MKALYLKDHAPDIDSLQLPAVLSFNLTRSSHDPSGIYRESL